MTARSRAEAAKLKSVILIPARFASSRYPGKPLAPLIGASGKAKPLIQRSFEAASKAGAASSVFVVTDDDRIAQVCEDFGAPVLMTSSQCRNGTERCAEALRQLPGVDLVINFQGDALLTPPAFLEPLIGAFDIPEVQVATPAIQLRSDEVRQLLDAESKGVVGGTTVVTDTRCDALYFSKRVIPHLPPSALESTFSPVRMHIGVYAYRPAALGLYAAASETELERLEGLEQLRFLALGLPVRVVQVEAPSFPLRELNNPGDVPAIEQALAQLGID